ncbi:MAG: sulfotransferase, partial [Candidatus Hermodarchaeota archaeon]
NALKQSFPDATIIHLIRDGRDVVRSMMARKTMTKDDPNTKHIYPLEGDPWKSKWSSMSRFEKLCWYWKTENEYLSLNLKDAIRFEDLISNYNYFHKNLLDPLNLEISEDLWRKEKESPKNVTTNYTLPHWKDWDTETLDSFNNICGEIMKDNNYL